MSKELIEYYRKGGPCVDYNDECRHRPSGCPCTDTANELERLEGALQAANEQLNILTKDCKPALSPTQVHKDPDHEAENSMCACPTCINEGWAAQEADDD